MEELYRLILVDDEDDVRGRILSKIKPEMGFEVVGKAGNGYDALELIEEFKPHVVITDIKMPFIGGIELARTIRRDYPTTKVAFISGYDEFEYAREAIELNVVAYLMKPITSQDIEEFLQKLKQTLDSEFDFLRNKNLIEERYNQSIPILINSYLNNFVQKKTLDIDDIKKLETYGLHLPTSNYVVGSISIDASSTSEEPKLFVKTLIDKVFNNFTYSINFLTPDNVVFVLQDDIINTANVLDLNLFEILKYAEEYRDMVIRIGISKVFHEFVDFPNAYTESMHALRHSKYFNMGNIIYFNEIESIETKTMIINETDLSELDNRLKFGDKHEIRDIITRVFDDFELAKNVALDHRLFSIKLVNLIIDFAASLNVKISDVSDGDILSNFTKISDKNEFVEYFMQTVMKIRELNVQTQINKTDLIIENAIKYIDDHYNDPSLSLEEVSEYLNISVSYLSMLLRKVKRITFSKYLVKVRMEKAKELLKFTNEKVINISVVCGYNEVYYFSHSFKKYTGMSPKEFRNNV